MPLEFRFLSGASSGNIESLTSLYQKAETLNITNKVINFQDKNGRTPLMLATYFNHPKVVQYLLGKGANLSIIDDYGNVALNFTRKSPNPYDTSPKRRLIELFEAHEKLKFLLRKDSNTSRVDDIGKTDQARLLATWALKNGDLVVLKNLIEQYPNVVDIKDKLGRTALHIAAQNGHLDVLKYLIFSLKMDVKSSDDKGQTPLILAARSGHLKVAEYLISFQWNISSTSGKFCQGVLLLIYIPV